MVPARALISLLLLALSACSAGETPPPAANAPMSVSTVAVQVREVRRWVVASGPVEAWEDIQLGAEIGGVRVLAVHAEVGQAVHAGQVLVELDARMLQSELRQAQASVREAQASADLARANLSRGEKLAQDKLISASALDELRATQQQAQARVSTAQAARDTSQLRVDFAKVRAPADGVVSSRSVRPGQIVAPGTELLRIIRDGKLEWRAQLPAAALASVEEGALVEFPSVAHPVQAHVRAVSPGVDDNTRTGVAYVDLPASAPLRAGSFIQGRILAGSMRALVLPAEAIVQRDGYAYVFLPDNATPAKVRRVRVQAGPAQEGVVPIQAGLVEGQRVVQKGAGFLSDGDPVRVLP